MLCLIVFGCQYQCNQLPGKTRLRNWVLCVEWDVKPYTLTQLCQWLLSCESSLCFSDCTHYLNVKSPDVWLGVSHTGKLIAQHWGVLPSCRLSLQTADFAIVADAAVNKTTLSCVARQCRNYWQSKKIVFLKLDCKDDLSMILVIDKTINGQKTNINCLK